MQIAQNYHIHLPLAAFLAALVMVVVVARHRTMPITTTFSVLMSSLAVWSLAVVLEHASLELSAKIFWMKMSYLGILSLPISWLVLTLRYANGERWLTRRNLTLLAVLPTITLVMVWTNDIHHLMWKDIWLDTSFSPPIDDVAHGAWFWIQAAYSYLLIFLGTLVLVRVYLHASTVYRKQVGVMLVGALVPWVANILYIAPIRLFQVLDPTPLAFAITGVAFSWGLFRLRLLDIMPIAHEAIFRSVVDGVIVLDAKGRVIELNPAALRIVARDRSGAVGQPYGAIFPVLAGRLQLGPMSSELQSAVSLGEGQTLRHYAVRVSPMLTKGQFGGHLVLLHDDTARMRTEMETRERIRLEAELVERRRSEESLRASETKYRNLVENAASGIIVSDGEGHILTANRAALSIFGYATEQEIGERPAMRLFVNEDDERRLMEPITRTGVARGFEVLMRRKDGGDFWASLNVIVQTAESGERQYLALVDDITTRKNAEEELAESRQNLRLLAQRVEKAREDERTSLARELHDQVGQTFTAIKMDLGRVSRLVGADDQETKTLLDGIAEMVDAGTDDVRRISSELRPGALDDLGLTGAIEFYLDQTASRTGIEFTFHGDSRCDELDDARSTAVFRVFQELVTNVVRHSGATRVTVSLSYEGGNCVLVVSDDGCGIDMRAVSSSHSLGVVGMKERLLPYGGELQLHGEPGKGTTARVIMPLSQA